MPSHRVTHKALQSGTLAPNLVDYEKQKAAFSWDAAREELAGLPDHKRLNIAYEAIDRHASGARAQHVALRRIDRKYNAHDFTYTKLHTLTNKFANALQTLNIDKGDRVFALTPRMPELYITALGTLKNRSVFYPLFSAFGPEPIQARLSIGQAKVLVTTAALDKRKIQSLRASLPQLQYVLLVGEQGQKTHVADTLDFHSVLAQASGDFSILATDPEDMTLLHFTSGTTGIPKQAAS